MLTTQQWAQFSAADKRNTWISCCALCPGILLFVTGLIGFHAVLPWNAGVISAASSGDFDQILNQTYSEVVNLWDLYPSDSDRNYRTSGQSFTLSQDYHVATEYHRPTCTASGCAGTRVKTREDFYDRDLPGDHMRFMIQEQAREGGIYFLAVGATCIFSMIYRTHYAARATSGLHLFLAVYCALHAFVFLKQSLFDSEGEWAPYMFTTGASMTVQIIIAIEFTIFSVLNIVSMVLGMMRAGELTANARAANIAGSGLVAGPIGSPEWKAMNGGGKGKQVVSSAGLCCTAFVLFGPIFYFSWWNVSGVTFMYYTSGDFDMAWENGTYSHGTTLMYNKYYAKTKKVDATRCFSVSLPITQCDCGDSGCDPSATPTPTATVGTVKVEVDDCKGLNDARMFIKTDIKLKTDRSGTAYTAASDKEYVIDERQECEGPNDDVATEGNSFSTRSSTACSSWCACTPSWAAPST